MLAILLKTLPFFAVIATGFLAGRARFLTPEATGQLTKFVFYFALSAMLFGFAANLDVSAIFSWPFVFAYLTATTAIWLIVAAVALAVAVGGAFGSVLRFLTSSWVVAQWPRHYYLATFAVNLVGCFLIGFLSAYFLLRSDLPLVLRTGLTVGVLGGLTTFSSFSLEVLRLLEAGQFGVAAGYLLSSVVGGLLAAWLGMSLARL